MSIRRYDINEGDRKAILEISRNQRAKISPTIAQKLMDYRLIIPRAGCWLLTLFGNKLATKIKAEKTATDRVMVKVGGDGSSHMKVRTVRNDVMIDTEAKELSLSKRYGHYKEGSVRREGLHWICGITCAVCGKERTVHTQDVYQVMRCVDCQIDMRKATVNQCKKVQRGHD